MPEYFQRLMIHGRKCDKAGCYEIIVKIEKVRWNQKYLAFLIKFFRVTPLAKAIQCYLTLNMIYK